jgi:hypothetical protein
MPNIAFHMQFSPAELANQFKYYTPFDSIDGFTIRDPGAIDLSSGVLAISPAPPDIAFIAKEMPLTPEILTWDKNKVLEFFASMAMVADNTAWAGIFAGSQNIGEEGIGVEFLRNSIRGFCDDSTGKAYINLLTGLPDGYYEEHAFRIESYPPVYIAFYVDGLYKGTLTTKIPHGWDYAWWVFNAYVKSGAASNPALALSSFKHVQDL